MLKGNWNRPCQPLADGCGCSQRLVIQNTKKCIQAQSGLYTEPVVDTVMTQHLAILSAVSTTGQVTTTAQTLESGPAPEGIPRTSRIRYRLYNHTFTSLFDRSCVFIRHLRSTQQQPAGMAIPQVNSVLGLQMYIFPLTIHYRLMKRPLVQHMLHWLLQQCSSSPSTV